MKGHRVLLYLKSRWRGIAAFAVFVAASGVCAALYSLPFEAVLYPALLVAAFAVVMAVLDILRTARRHGALSALRALPDDLSDYLPEPDTIAEEDLSDIIRRLEDRISRLTDDFSRREADTINYYTMWAHQIKTPISAMSLILKNTDTHESRRLSAELSRVSQYVDMVMAYLRLGSDSTDYTFRETPLDDILRAEVRSFASEFIYRKIALDSRSSDELLRLFGEINAGGQTILMVTHSVGAASRAGRVLFIRDGVVFHQLFRGDDTPDAFYRRISDTLTIIATGADIRDARGDSAVSGGDVR